MCQEGYLAYCAEGALVEDAGIYPPRAYQGVKLNLDNLKDVMLQELEVFQYTWP